MAADCKTNLSAPGLTYMMYVVIARPHGVVYQLWRLGMI